MGVFNGLRGSDSQSLSARMAAQGITEEMVRRQMRENEGAPYYDLMKPPGAPPASSAPAQMNPRLQAMLGPAPQQQQKKGLAGVLGDNFLDKATRAMAIANGDWRAAGAITDNLSKRQAAEQERSIAYNNALQVAQLEGMTEAEFAAYLANPEQWGSNTSDALSTHRAAANVGQTETRVYGNPAQGGSTFQPTRLIDNGVDQIRYDPATGQQSIAVQGMTGGEQYARSLGAFPGTPLWQTALQDEALRGEGPTAQANALAMETTRQRNRMATEATRQQNRIGLRNTPQARAAAPSAAAAPKEGDIATDGKGNRVILRNKQWVPLP